MHQQQDALSIIQSNQKVQINEYKLLLGTGNFNVRPVKSDISPGGHPYGMLSLNFHA